MSHLGETILNSSTSKLLHNLATLPTFKGPFGSTKITFKLEKFFFKIIQGYEDILINLTYLQDQFQNLAPSREVHDTVVEIEEMLLRVGYLLKHTSKAKISKFKKFILRANTSKHEINVLRGIFHQINWFLNNSHK